MIEHVRGRVVNDQVRSLYTLQTWWEEREVKERTDLAVHSADRIFIGQFTSVFPVAHWPELGLDQ